MEYQNIFESYMEKGYIHQVPLSQIKDRDAFYIPWFPVVDQIRLTTQVRIVFGAAARDVHGMSLNSEIQPGPNCLQDLFKILLRMRRYQYLVTSDVSKIQKVMWINCDINRTENPEAVETVKNSCYMDNCCDSQETKEQATNLVKQLAKLLELAVMVIQKFYSNSGLAITQCNPSLLSKQISFEDKDVVYKIVKN